MDLIKLKLCINNIKVKEILYQHAFFNVGDVNSFTLILVPHWISKISFYSSRFYQVFFIFICLRSRPVDPDVVC